MKILHCVEFYHPSVGGAQEGVKQLSERLVKLGHDVTVATTRLATRKVPALHGVNIQEFDIRGNFVRGISGEVERYQNYLKESDFDVIMNYAAQQWTTDATLPLLAEIKAKKVFVPCGFSGLYSPDYREYFESMKGWMKQYDICVFLSNYYRDIDFARANSVEHIKVIPNGAGADEFSEVPNADIRKYLGIPENHCLILHVGSHTGHKGHAEALKIFSKAKIKNAVFLMVANKFSERCAMQCALSAKTLNISPSNRRDGKKVIITELTREETLAAYHAADLFLFPSNVECSPLVLFEAMASKTAFLTTDVGNAKEIITWSDGGKLLPTEEINNGYARAKISESVEVLEEMYRSRDTRETLAQAGHRAWQARFTWEKITLQYEDLYKRLVNA